MNSFFPAGGYITGERLQQLADISILTDPIARFHKNLSGLSIRLCRLPGTMTDLTVADPEQLKPVKDAEVVFVYAHLLGAFFEKIFPLLDRPFILMSHNSDHGVDGRFSPFLDHGRLFKWFAQNVTTDHPRLVSLPLGVANAQWPHGRLDLLDQAAQRRAAKSGLVYMNFNVKTNPALRQPVFDRLGDHPLVTASSGLDYPTYLHELSSHHFAVCPPGNGLDCHRIWECLYLGVIPLVSARFRLRGFDRLPILYVEDWGQIDGDFLKAAYERLARREVRMEQTRLEHWQRTLERERLRLRQARGETKR